MNVGIPNVFPVEEYLRGAIARPFFFFFFFFFSDQRSLEEPKTTGVWPNLERETTKNDVADWLHRCDIDDMGRCVCQ